MAEEGIRLKTASLAWKLGQAAAFALVVGTAVQLFRGGAFSAFLHMQKDFPPTFLKLADQGLAVLMLLLAAMALLKRFQLAWLLVALLLLLYGLTSFNTAGKWHAEWHLLSALSRALFPVLLFWWGWRAATPLQMQAAFRGLLALVFFSHGTLAALQTPDFIDYVLGSFYKLSATYIDEGLVHLGLYVVAFMDVAIALLIIFRPQPWVFVWAFGWIMLTFLMRLLTGGWMNYTEVLMRLPYLYMPWFLWHSTRYVKAR